MYIFLCFALCLRVFVFKLKTSIKVYFVVKNISFCYIFLPYYIWMLDLLTICFSLYIVCLFLSILVFFIYIMSVFAIILRCHYYIMSVLVSIFIYFFLFFVGILKNFYIFAATFRDYSIQKKIRGEWVGSNRKA